MSGVLSSWLTESRNACSVSCALVSLAFMSLNDTASSRSSFGPCGVTVTPASPSASRPLASASRRTGRTTLRERIQAPSRPRMMMSATPQSPILTSRETGVGGLERLQVAPVVGRSTVPPRGSACATPRSVVNAPTVDEAAPVGADGVAVCVAGSVIAQAGSALVWRIDHGAERCPLRAPRGMATHAEHLQTMRSTEQGALRGREPVTRSRTSPSISSFSSRALYDAWLGVEWTPPSPSCGSRPKRRERRGRTKG